MPKRSLDPNEPRKPNPTGVRKAAKGKSWQHVDRVGDWEPVLSDETTVLTKKEKNAGDTKITREDREVAKELEKELGREATKAEREARKAERAALKAANNVKPG